VNFRDECLLLSDVQSACALDGRIHVMTHIAGLQNTVGFVDDKEAHIGQRDLPSRDKIVHAAWSPDDDVDT
jgi:hypothetical protein